MNKNTLQPVPDKVGLRNGLPNITSMTPKESATWETPLKFDPRVHIPDSEKRLIAIAAPAYMQFSWRADARHEPNAIYAMLTIANILGNNLEISQEDLKKRQAEEVEHIKSGGMAGIRRNVVRFSGFILDQENASTYAWAKQLLGPLYPQKLYNEDYSNAHLNKASFAPTTTLPLRIMLSGDSLKAFAKQFFAESLNPEAPFWNKEREELIKHRNQLIADPSPVRIIAFAQNFAYVKLLFPERFTKELEITNIEWDAMRHLLEENATRLEVNSYALLAFYMTILATEDVGIAKNGQIFINLPPLTKVGGEKAEAIPKMLEVTP